MMNIHREVEISVDGEVNENYQKHETTRVSFS